ncbi:hypothetical protein X566_04790 [Afipia sp. P52-10]|uniref:DUF5666 domain-containing protein n=1 Tax=Afipia sp. P52-10 TaxID=1429916 RepID=UPI0003DEF8C2|nr:DUF5666 domain-containing protein [Afipia sp. P52-10]ETR77017.1 hypothetical protein X566_04790 [Afipia sp. P52-10]
MPASARLSSLVLAAGLVGVFAVHAVAQPAQNRRIRGIIEKLDGHVLTVKARDGADVTIKLADNYAVTAYTKAQLADIKVGSYIGVAGTPQPDGRQKAISITIFPESARGLGDGFRPWDLPNSTMTNAAVAEAVASPDGQTLKVKYKDGEKTILVPPATPIGQFSPGERTELKVGAAVAVPAVTKPDGSLESSRVGVGRDGFVPN